MALSGAEVTAEDDPYRFACPLLRERLTITAGKIAMFNIFDDNRYLGCSAGDRRLRYRLEMVVEDYYAYAWVLAPGTALTADAKLIANPAHNADRGPVPVLALRLRGSF